jgi:uncharacterized delta-60 repeat protein
MRSLLLALAVGLAATPAAFAAQPGTLDRGFGGDGGVQARVDQAPLVAGIEVLPGGRIVVIGTVGDKRLALLRWGRRGQHRGAATLTFSEGVHLDETVLTPSGNLLLAGTLGTDAAVLAVTPDGRLDPSFGQGGVWRVDLGGEGRETATGLALQADGRMLVAIDIDHAQRSGASWHDLAVARLTSAGQLDSTYAEAGIRRINGTSEAPLAPVALELDAQERAMVGFRTGYIPKMTNGAGVLRLTTDGSPDPTYGGILGVSLRGLTLAPDSILYDMAFDPVGDRPLLTGSQYIEESGAYAFAGSTSPRVPPDPNYPDYLGEETTLRLVRSGGWGKAVLLDRERSVIVGGSAGGAAPLLFRATTDLRKDPGFGTSGRAFTRGRLTTLGAIALQPDGGILAAGPGVLPNGLRNARERRVRLVRLHGGYDRSGPRFSIRLSENRCEGRVRITVRATDESPLRRMRVRIDGRRLAAVNRKRVTIAARVAPRAGVHKVVVRAHDVAGNLGARSRSFTCPS